MPADHFYTTNVGERDAAVNNGGYHVEGIACHVSPNLIAGTTDFLRLWNPTVDDHLYTTSASEATNAVQNDGYRSEGTACFIYPGQAASTSPFYRLYNGTDHFYTASAQERDAAIAQGGYQLEDVAGYIWLTAEPGTTEPFWRLWNGGHPLTEATSVDINSIVYDTANAVIQQTTPVNLYNDTVTNSSPVSQTSTISGSQSVTDTSGWQDTLTVSIQAKTTFSLGIPVIAGGSVEIQVGVTNAYAWNGSESRQTTWSWSQPITVPANSSVAVAVVVSQSTVIVPYTTTSTFHFSDGSTITCETFGTYTGVNSHDVQVNIT